MLAVNSSSTADLGGVEHAGLGAEEPDHADRGAVDLQRQRGDRAVAQQDGAFAKLFVRRFAMQVIVDD